MEPAGSFGQAARTRRPCLHRSSPAPSPSALPLRLDLDRLAFKRLPGFEHAFGDAFGEAKGFLVQARPVGFGEVRVIFMVRLLLF